MTAQKDKNAKALSDGRIATWRDAIGADLITASQLADGDGDVGLGMAIVAVVAKIDGEKVTYEDIKALGLTDVTALMAGITGNAPT